MTDSLEARLALGGREGRESVRAARAMLRPGPREG